MDSTPKISPGKWPLFAGIALGLILAGGAITTLLIATRHASGEAFGAIFLAYATALLTLISSALAALISLIRRERWRVFSAPILGFGILIIILGVAVFGQAV